MEQALGLRMPTAAAEGLSCRLLPSVAACTSASLRCGAPAATVGSAMLSRCGAGIRCSSRRKQQLCHARRIESAVSRRTGAAVEAAAEAVATHAPPCIAKDNGRRSGGWTQRPEQQSLRKLSVAAAAAAVAGDGASSSGEEERGPVVIIDNYDSFTYNLCQYLGDLGCEYVVFRNDDITIDELKAMNPRGVLISPGPGTPDDSGISLDVVRFLSPTVPLFGVCMGLQCIGQAFGGRIVRAPHGVMHGKTSPVFHTQADTDSGLLAGLPSPFTACRYHSLVIERDTFPEEQLEVTAWTEDGLVMAVRHKHYPHVEAVQFHPESIITSHGKNIVRNWLNTVERFWDKHATPVAV